MTEVIIRKAEDGAYALVRDIHPPPMYIAEVPIRNAEPQRKAVGLGYSREEALTNLVRWLAGAATGFNLTYAEGGPDDETREALSLSEENLRAKAERGRPADVIRSNETVYRVIQGKASIPEAETFIMKILNERNTAEEQVGKLEPFVRGFAVSEHDEWCATRLDEEPEDQCDCVKGRARKILEEIENR